MKSHGVVVFTDVALHRQLKTQCVAQGQTMTAVVEALVRGWLDFQEAVPPPEAEPLPPPEAEPLPPVVRRVEAPVVEVPVCRRCGHEQKSHWVKGCVAGCGCSDQRYLSPPR